MKNMQISKPMRISAITNRYALPGMRMIGFVASMVVLINIAQGQISDVGSTTRLQDIEDAIIAADIGEGTLAENWTPVCEMLSDVDVETDDPVLRLIKGHACLAANQNNESFNMFLCTRSSDDLQAWRSWSSEFALQHKDCAIANYYKGDSFSRHEQWGEAIAEFTKGLSISPEHLLILNARGVSYAYQEKWDLAEEDFLLAISLNPSFRDASANIATKLIHKIDGVKGAIEWFDYALQQSQGNEFALAYYLRACTKCVMGDVAGITEDIEEATKGDDAQSIFLKQRAHEVVMRIQNSCLTLASTDGREASMSIVHERERITNDMNTIVNDGNVGFLRTHFSPMVEDYKTGTPERQRFIEGEINRGIQENPGITDDIEISLKQFERNTQIQQALFNGISISSGVSARGSGFIAVPGLISGGEGEVSSEIGLWEGGPLAELQTHDLNMIRQLHNNLNLNSNADGFKGGIQGGYWDKGDWPFDPIYGLLYSSASTNDN